MSKELKIILLSLLAILVGIQFFPTDKPGNDLSGASDIFNNSSTPEIETLVRNACYDCHSQEVTFPWYASVAPVSWLVNRDINHGRINLDFSKWGDYTKREKLNLLSEIADEVATGSMPMPIYIIMHDEANLDPNQREQLIEWSEQMAEAVFEE